MFYLKALRQSLPVMWRNMSEQIAVTSELPSPICYKVALGPNPQATHDKSRYARVITDDEDLDVQIRKTKSRRLQYYSICRRVNIRMGTKLGTVIWV